MGRGPNSLSPHAPDLGHVQVNVQSVGRSRSECRGAIVLPMSLGGHRMEHVLAVMTPLGNEMSIGRPLSDTVKTGWIDASNQMRPAKPHGWAHQEKP